MENLGMINYKDIFTQTYRNKRVLITGHTGFKGAWLLSWLYLLGAEVKGYALVPENRLDLYNQINGDNLCQSIIADIRDKDRLKKEILEFKPDFIFHLAAQALVRLSYEKPTETFETNTLGTAYLLDTLRFLESPCVVVVITTDKVYDNKEWHYPYRENDRLGGYDPYSASKAMAELLVSSYQNSFFNKNEYINHFKSIAAARAGNVIGGGDWAKDRIIPDLIRALQQNQAVIVRNPQAVRPWQHVIEPLSGYLLLGARLIENPTKYAEAWNFGPLQDDTFTVESLVREAITIWGQGNLEKPNLTNQPHEAGLLKLDINKSINELGWKPKWGAMQAIQETINFYKFGETQPLEYLKKQINDYQNK
ncbi:CDP-glucose 4,6-dehydratase [Runella rosea]|nr:CDP-glucose 4,6-dehydratase [Runella rosea]